MLGVCVCEGERAGPSLPPSSPLPALPSPPLPPSLPPPSQCRSVLENGVQGKAVLDAVIDHCSQMQNLREVRRRGRGEGRGRGGGGRRQGGRRGLVCPSATK